MNKKPDHLPEEIFARWQKLLDGVQKYQTYPYARAHYYPAPVWQSGTTKLYDYGPEGEIPLLVVPSLINRAYILDIESDHSFLQWLRQNGVRPFLLDWDAPGDEEKKFSLEDYVVQRALPALDYVAQATASKPALLGYCMGGLLTTALAVLKPEQCSAMALLATPWDFHKDIPVLPLEARILQADLIDRIGFMPVDMIQSFFWSLDPLQVAKKFLKFADYDMQSTKARQFVVLEDWLNDGVPLAAKVARECLVGWYGNNAPALGQWQVGGATINPAQIKMPTLAIIPQQDRIVPPASAAALSQAIPGCLRIDPPLGHIGMMTSKDAEKYVWQPLLDWLKKIQ